jgi:hypothetical protein
MSSQVWGIHVPLVKKVHVNGYLILGISRFSGGIISGGLDGHSLGEYSLLGVELEEMGTMSYCISLPCKTREGIVGNRFPYALT